MILTKKLKIKVSNSTTKHYKSKGYICNSKDVIEISVNDLPIQSTKEIKVKCDICGDEKIIQYRRYINNKKNKNFYVCSLSCAQEKIKLTKIENHGDPSFSNIEKRKETCKERYNNETYKNVEKRTETNLEKYGTEHAIILT